MLTAHDVAAYVLHQRGPMSAMKMQKLVYYAQAWSLALLGRPLFEEDVQAWAHGPVVYELFDHHRGRFVVRSWERHGDANALHGKAKNVLDAVLEHYAGMSAEDLSALTHRERPWVEARATAAQRVRASPIITCSAMREFYGSMNPPFSS